MSRVSGNIATDIFDLLKALCYKSLKIDQRVFTGYHIGNTCFR